MLLRFSRESVASRGPRGLGAQGSVFCRSPRGSGGRLVRGGARRAGSRRSLAGWTGCRAPCWPRCAIGPPGCAGVNRAAAPLDASRGRALPTPYPPRPSVLRTCALPCDKGPSLRRRQWSRRFPALPFPHVVG